jgi:hypothetical protein
MNAYFFNLTKEEKENILDKHKTLYNGYATKNTTSNEQPLHVQDFANDKNGITIKSAGEVSNYNNKIYMKESSEECTECGYMEEDTDEGIYDVQDLNGKFDYVEEKELDEINPKKLKKGKKYKYHSPTFEDEIEYEGKTKDDEGEKMHSFKGNKSNHLMADYMVNKFVHDTDLDESVSEKVKTQLTETINMFNRFKKYN